MDQYQAYFHHEEIGSTTGIIFAMYTIGSMVGAVSTSAVCDNLGQHAGMAIGANVIITNAIVVTAAQNDAYLLAGRFIFGLGISLGTSAVLTYAIELAPPQ